MSAHWTPAEIAEITRLVECGQTHAEAAAIMGCSKSAIKKLLERERHRRGLTHRGRRAWSEEDRAKLAAMVAVGKSHAEIGAALGRSAIAIRDALCRRPVERPTSAVLAMAPAPRQYTADELAWAMARPLHPEAVMIRAMHQRMSPAEWLGMIRAAAARQSAAQGQGRVRRLASDVPAEMAAQVALQPRYEGAV